MESTDNPLIRKSRVKDVPITSEIVNWYAQKGVMLPRPIARIYSNIRDFFVVEVSQDNAECLIQLSRIG